MQEHKFMRNVVHGAALALAFTFSAQAGANRTFVATTGNDANTSVGCGATTNCRTFAAALSVTNSGGEIVAVNSGGYGPFTITQPVTITAIGIDASITATSGDALDINTSGNVTITGLNLFGGGTGNHGVLVQGVGVLRLYNTQIQGFASNGIDLEAGGSVAVYSSKVNDCANGLYQNGGQVYARNTEFDSNQGAGAESVAGTMAIADSSSHHNTVGFYANGGAMALYNDRAIFNGVGIASASSGVLYFAHSLLSDNTTSYSIASATMFGSIPGTSLITPGQGTIGTLGTAINVQ